MFPYRRVPALITGLYIFTVVNFLFLCHAAIVQGTVDVKFDNDNETVAQYDDLPALFGPRVPEDGFRGFHCYANPIDGCSALQKPPSIGKWIVVIKRNGCSFDTKVRNAQVAGYKAAIIHGTAPGELVRMSPNSSTIDIIIPSFFVDYRAGMALKKKYTYEEGYYLIIYDEDNRNTNMMEYIIAFACILVFIFLTAVTSLIVRYIRDLRQRRRHRLSPQHLKKLPVKKYTKGETQYETCAICLEDYVEGDKMRILPCSHAYHTKCIDPWLTKSRRTCPLCKIKVFSGGEISDSDGDSDDDENTPLFNAHNQPTTSGNTFTSLPSHLVSRNQAVDVSLPEDTVTTSNNFTASLLQPASMGMSINMEDGDLLCTTSVGNRTNVSQNETLITNGHGAGGPIQIGVNAAFAPLNELPASNAVKEHVLVV